MISSARNARWTWKSACSWTKLPRNTQITPSTHTSTPMSYRSSLRAGSHTPPHPASPPALVPHRTVTHERHLHRRTSRLLQGEVPCLLKYNTVFPTHLICVKPQSGSCLCMQRTNKVYRQSLWTLCAYKFTSLLQALQCSSRYFMWPGDF